MSARQPHAAHRRTAGTLLLIVSAAVAVVVLAIVLLFVMTVGGQFFDILSYVSYPTSAGGVGASAGDIGMKSALAMFGSIGILSIPAAVGLKLLIGGRGSAPEPPRGGGPF